MEPLWIFLAALTGYLLGSISFARLIAGLVAPGKDFRHIKVEIPDHNDYIQSDVISATTVRLNVGPKWGCLVSILDMVKSGLPMLVFRFWQPDQPYYLIAGGMAVVGHIWPVYYRFKGGRGLSPVLGNFLVLDWLGVLVTNLAGFLLGLGPHNIMIVTSAGIVLMIPWIWFRTHDPLQLTFVLLCTSLYYYSMIPEWKEYARLRRKGTLRMMMNARNLRVVHPDGTVTEDSMTLATMIDRLKKFGRHKG